MPTPPAGTLQEYVYLIPQFLSNVIIPALLALAFFMVVVNVVRYFVIHGDSEDGRKRAKAQIIYSLAAFVVIFIFWGILILLSTSFGFTGINPSCPDYLRSVTNNPCQSTNYK